MVTDRWPEQEGIIIAGLTCGFAYTASGVTEGDWLTWGTSADDRIVVETVAAASLHQGWCRAGKTVAAGGTVPIIISGIVKVLADETLAIGTQVGTKTATQLTGIGASNIMTYNGGTQFFIGCLLQATTDESDEVLMLMNTGVAGLTG